MFDFGTLNTESKKTVRDGINSQEWEFKKLKEFVGQEIPVNGFFFTDGGKYGKSVVVVADGVKVNLPKRYVERFEEIRDNKEALDALLGGHLKLVNIREINAEQGKTAAFDFATV